MPNLFRRNKAISLPCQEQRKPSRVISIWEQLPILPFFLVLLYLFSLFAYIQIRQLLDAPRNVPVNDTTSADRLVPYFADDHPQYHTDAAVHVKKLPAADVLRVVLANLKARNLNDPQFEQKTNTALRCVSAADLNISSELAQLLATHLTNYAETTPTSLTGDGLLLPAVQNLQINRLLDADHLRRLISAADFRARQAIINTELKFAKEKATANINAVSTLSLEELTALMVADMLVADQWIRIAVRVFPTQIQLLRDLESQGKTLETAVATPAVSQAFLCEVVSCTDSVLQFLNPPKTSGPKTVALPILPSWRTTSGVIGLALPPKRAIRRRPIQSPFEQQKRRCIDTWERLRASLKSKPALP